MMETMRLTSPSEPGPEPGPGADDDLDAGVTGLLRGRRLVIRVLLVLFLLLPVAGLLRAHHHNLAGHPGFLVLGTLAFVVLVDRTVLVQMPEPGRYVRWQWVLLVILFALAAALFAVGGMSWLTALAVASAGVGRFTSSGRATAIGLVCCIGITVGIGAATGLNYGNTIIAGAVAALANLLAHSAERRNALMYRLKETRAELARSAVAEERLRISRDLHDLLGHSLSLITLKAELAGRVIGTDPERAAREISELETVARRSLTEVRQAVTSYRQPSLAAELVSSRRMLASAGIDCRVRVPGAYSLPSPVDALLAWTVREGATNIVRHAAARHAEIVVEMTDTEASACVSDDGIGPSANGAVPGAAGGETAAGPDTTGARAHTAAAPASGSGLTGLAERAARLGGTLSAGVSPAGGFRLRVSVPLTGPPGDDHADATAIEPAGKTGDGRAAAEPSPGAGRETDEAGGRRVPR
jgi:two-component system sensor histidine kinase DesK